MSTVMHSAHHIHTTDITLTHDTELYVLAVNATLEV